MLCCRVPRLTRRCGAQAQLHAARARLRQLTSAPPAASLPPGSPPAGRVSGADGPPEIAGALSAARGKAEAAPVSSAADSGSVEAAQARVRELEQVATGVHVVAPCAHDGACPMDAATTAAGWCHFRQRFERTYLHRVCVPASIPV